MCILIFREYLIVAVQFIKKPHHSSDKLKHQCGFPWHPQSAQIYYAYL